MAGKVKDHGMLISCSVSGSRDVERHLAGREGVRVGAGGAVPTRSSTGFGTHLVASWIRW